MALIVCNKSDMQAVQKQTEAEFNRRIGTYQATKRDLENKLRAQEAELQAAKLELASAQTALSSAQNALSSALSMPSNTTEDARERADKVRSARNAVSNAQTRITNANNRITAAENEIATLKAEIEKAGSAIETLKQGITTSREKMQVLMDLVREIDGAFYISMEGATSAIIDYINAMKKIQDEFDAKYSGKVENPLAGFGIWNTPINATGLDLNSGDNSNLDKTLKEVFGEYKITEDQSLNNYYRNLELLESKEFQEALENATDENGLIIKQSLVQDILYGLFPDVDNHCGWIAAYNASILLGNKQSIPDIIRELEKKGLIRDGKWGTYPFPIADYIKDLGYKASSGIPIKIDKAIPDGKVAILMFAYPDILKNGAHYVTIEKVDEQYIIYNYYGEKIQESSIDTWLQGKDYTAILLTIIDR